jgi:hypothetical protein
MTDSLLRLENRATVYNAVFPVIPDSAITFLSRGLGGSETGQSHRDSETGYFTEDFGSNVVVVLYGIAIADILPRHVFRSIHATAAN